MNITRFTNLVDGQNMPKELREMATVISKLEKENYDLRKQVEHPKAPSVFQSMKSKWSEVSGDDMILTGIITAITTVLFLLAMTGIAAICFKIMEPKPELIPDWKPPYSTTPIYYTKAVRDKETNEECLYISVFQFGQKQWVSECFSNHRELLEALVLFRTIDLPFSEHMSVPGDVGVENESSITLGRTVH